MLRFALGALVVALVAGVLGFGGIAGTAVGLAKIAFGVFLIVALLLFVMGKRVVV